MTMPPDQPKRARRRNAVLSKPPKPITKKGRATRERLKAALSDLLQGRSYYEIRIEDITARAGVRAGLFYRYFQSKVDIAQEVLTDMLGEFQRDVVSRARGNGPVDAIHHANQRMVALYANNPGAMRCLLETQEGSGPFSNTWRSLTLDWNKRIASSIARQFPKALPRKADYIAFACALSGMVDNFLFEYYVLKSPALHEACQTDEAVASFLTTLWCRTLYLENPPKGTPGALTKFGRIAGLSSPKARARRTRSG